MRLTLKLNFLYIIAALILSVSLYKASLSYFFFQDDFYEINISKANNLSEFIGNFKFLKNRSSYRPLGLQAYFFTSYKLFGLSPVAFRLITFTLFFATYFLIIKVIERITTNFKVGILTGSFWVTSSIHFMSLTWIAAAWLIFGVFFFMLTSLFFLNFLRGYYYRYYILSLITFVISLATSEFSITWPIIFGFYYFIVKNNKLTKTLKLFSPFIFFSIIYLFLRSNLSSLPQIPEYKVVFNLESIKALFWYLLWTFNIPEEFKKQIVNNLLIFNKTFIKEYWFLILKSFLGFALIFIVGIILPVILSFKEKISLDLRFIVFTFIWFLTGIFPVLLLPNHTFSMYLALASIGLYLLISYLILKIPNKTLVLLLILIWIFTSYTSISFYRDNSWMVESQRFAREFTSRMFERFPTLPSNSTVLFPLQDGRYIQAILDQNAIKAVYNDPSLKIYFDKSKIINDFENGTTEGFIYVFQQ